MTIYNTKILCYYQDIAVIKTLGRAICTILYMSSPEKTHSE